MVDTTSSHTKGVRKVFTAFPKHYYIERFPKMERENAGIAQLYADTIDSAYNQCSGKGDLECLEIMKRALRDFMEQVDGV